MTHSPARRSARLEAPPSPLLPLEGGPQPTAPTRTLVIGVGSTLRGDDALGLEVARRLAERHPADTLVLAHLGDAASLMECWKGAERVILVDAARGAGRPGTVRRLDLSVEALPESLLTSSSHSMGLREAVELARVLGRLPRELIVYAVEGGSFDAVHGLTEDVSHALEGVTQAILEDVALEPRKAGPAGAGSPPGEERAG